MTPKAAARQERSDLADLLSTLTPAQWDAPTLCDGWRVRDVVAHVIGYDEIGLLGALTRMAKAGFSLDRANAATLATPREPAELLDALRRHLTPRGITAAFGGRIALLDCTVHHQDIRRPLGLPREIPPERLRHALGFLPLAYAIDAPRRIRGLRLVAEDIDWTHGDGPELRGTGEAVLMATAGRHRALDELTGDGVTVLAARIRR
ncbi:maleylpyruvate isomerase family mycothiol-dependent enzyme [Phytomonospora endophytica]|uniref:Uncharacterized protein (TIGR03083 family) n=1 Tax=Phytomonospora endophytica TaxID=714109 RepID=A0A841G2K8_9ACTN|nr:maleylpyruvate isomerase family mycothiol-dependent enzyme [Phytomonospora endophytica]MBB6038370.1 uncharacterized protein (TIGR03083 family) [Phytomonospora endophytica]GIG64301.1 hypothetical protein Pen01_05960 [Phytomonospora endophytica]